MAKRTKVCVAAMAVALLVGCGRTSGFLRDANTVNENQFRMNIASERYARSAQGSSSIGSILCIAPLGNGMYAEAMRELHATARLQTNEVLANIREDHAFTFWLLFCEDSLVISADVYQVYLPNESVPPRVEVRQDPTPPPPAKPSPQCDPLMWSNSAQRPEQHPECPQPPAAPATPR